MISVHIWKKLKAEYYDEKSTDFLNKLKFIGVDTISVWEDVDIDFYKKAKDIGLKVTSLIPYVLKKEVLNPFVSASGSQLNQNNFTSNDSHEFSLCVWCILKM
jgi:hypothetical protein